MIRRLLVDISPLRGSPAFRRFWFSGLLSSIGTQMTMFAVMLQVYLISHSTLAVGGVGLASALPGIGFGVVGGTLIDSMDRRRLVLMTSSGLMLVSLAFTLQAWASADQVLILYALVALQAALTAVNLPARMTMTLDLLPAEQLQAGTALTTLVFHSALIVGPALGGVLVASGSLTLCYLIDAIGFVVAMYGVARLPSIPPLQDAPVGSLRAVLDGLKLLRRSKVLAGALIADVNATFLAMPIALFPAINAARFGGSPRTLGLLSASLAVGGVLGSTLSGPLRSVRNQGQGMLVGGAVWGAALAGFGFAHGLALSLGLLAVAGAGDVASVVMRQTIIQLASPPEYLGRINATNFAVGAGVPQLGNFRAGIVGSVTSPSASAAVGGLASLIGTGIIALAAPALVRYQGSAALRDGPRIVTHS